MYACLKGHVQAVLAFLPYLKTTESVNTALRWAVAYNHVTLVELVLQHPMLQVNGQFQGQTPLYQACKMRNPKIVKLLLEANGDPNALIVGPEPFSFHQARTGSYKRGYTALYALAKWEPTSKASWPYKTDEPDPEATIDCFNLMFKAGVNVHQVDVQGNTAMHHVKEIVALRILLEAGANPNAVNDNGETILHRCENMTITRLLLEEVKVASNQKTLHGGYTPLLSWLSKGSVEHALQLLEFGADAGVVDNDGNSAFHHAVGIRNFGDIGQQLIERLVAAGADINFKNHRGQTPLHILGTGINNVSTSTFDEKAFTALIAAGADPELKDHRGQTPLFQKVGSGNLRTGERMNLCEMMTKAGARIDTVDSSGCNLLHSCVSNDPNDLEIFNFLVSHDVDPKQTDNDGNTLCHKAALYYAKMRCGANSHSLQIFDVLIKLGIHPGQPNYSGRTALHLLSSILPGCLDNGTTLIAGETTAFDCVLKLQSSIDSEDRKGVTALHLASTFSEYQTRRLLQAGADPSKATHEKLTALHLAARSWQPNILGMLLDSLKSQNNQEGFSTIINARDGYMQTALFYACASGRVESVKLLIDAGADVDAQYYSCSPWKGCLAFENEANNLQLSNVQHSGDRSRADAGGVMILDTTRPQLFKQGSYSTASLDEIIQLLSSYAPKREFIESAIAEAGRLGLDYTIGCLWQARRNLGIEDEYRFNLSSHTTLCKRQANRKALEDTSSRLQTSLSESNIPFRQLMQMREYDLVSELLLKSNGMEIDEDGDMVINHLTSGGFASIVARVMTREAAGKLEDWEWCEQHTTSSQVRNPYTKPENVQPLLLTACKRELPNMDVIRVLVEKVGVNINAQDRKDNQYCPPGGTRYAHSKSALHYLAGGNNWWHADAVKYLVNQGANMNLRDELGLTPLASALDRIGLLTFNRSAVEMFIKLGADVNSVDNKGVSCLARAGDDVQMIECLIQHGAVVTPSALISAIKKKSPEALKALLSHGANPNARQIPNKAEENAMSSMWWARMGPSGVRAPQVAEEMYPLHFAAIQERVDGEINENLVKILLNHGADPCARYSETTVIHRIIEESYLVQLFVALPSLDLEARDSLGRTLLMVACYSRFGSKNQVAATTLLDRGADIRALDNNNQNILHHLLTPTSNYANRELISRIAAEAPELVNEADKHGNTPFHFAITLFRHSHRTSKGEADALLRAGADPKAANNDGDTPMHLLFGGEWVIGIDGMVRDELREVFDSLLRMGSDINARNGCGETPIFAFFNNATIKVEPTKPYQTPGEYGLQSQRERDESPIYRLFEEAGVDWFAVNNSGETLLHVVARKMMSHVDSQKVSRFKFLLGKGLDPMSEDGNQRTSVDVAAEVGAKDIFGLFERR